MGTAFTSPSTARVPKDTPNRDHRVSSTFNKTVCLQDWWLIRSESEFQGKRLGVGGLTAERPMRLFFSAPIIKRHDLYTLETADGIAILIKGSVNRSRMQENGFLSEVCNHFLIGFPYYWEDFTCQCMQKESTIGEFTTSSFSISNTSNICKHNDSELLEHDVQRGEFEKSKPVSGDVSKDLAISLKEKAVSSPDADQRITEDFLHEDIGAKRKFPLNASKGKSIDSSSEKTSVQNDVSLQERSLLKNLILINASPSVVDKGDRKHSTTCLRSAKKFDGFGDRLRAISSSIKTPNVCSSVRQNSANDLVGMKIHVGDKAGLPNINLGSGAENLSLGSAIDNSTKLLAELRNESGEGCNDDALKASAKAGDSCAGDISPLRLNAVVPTKASVYLESSSEDLGSLKSYEGHKKKTRTDGLSRLTKSNHPKSSYRESAGSAGERKNATKADKYMLQENENLVADTSRGNLLHCNSELPSDVCSNGVPDKNLSVDTRHPSGSCVLSERLQTDNFDGMQDPSSPMNAAKFVACSSKSIAANAKTKIDASLDMKKKGGMCLSTECVVGNENGGPTVMLQAAEDPAAKHQAERSASYKGKKEKARKKMSSSEYRRSNRLKGSNNIKDMEPEKNNFHAVSLDSNSVKSAFGIVDDCRLDSSCMQSDRTMCESLGGENVGSQHIHQISSMSFSTPTDPDVVLKQNFGSDSNLIECRESTEQNIGSDVNATESRKPTEHCSSSVQFDTSDKTELKISEEGVESPNTQQEISRKRTKRKLEYASRSVKNVTTSVRTRSTRKNITSVSPESLSYKRSRSGRLLVPPLNFWCNEQVVYDMDGQITGIIPGVKSNAGMKMEILQKKKKVV
ncbi:hypothetical protein Sjap_012777 [Stephania japonica]|uniref:SANTA domain-containing protein n=1 Tax=Stephania japonica TaxID=461633 RepID=A0AAP0NZ93_9MAGN